MSFPVEPRHISQFAKQNDISVDVYTLYDEKISPLRKTVIRKLEHVDSLLIHTLNNFHNVWIKNVLCLLKGFTVLPENYPDKADVAQSENRN